MSIDINLVFPENGETTIYPYVEAYISSDASGFYIVRLYVDGALFLTHLQQFVVGDDNWLRYNPDIGFGPHFWYVTVSAYPSDILLATSSVYSFTYVPEGLFKPTDPTPANASGPGINFSDFTFSWTNIGGAEMYDIYFGSSPLSLNRFVTNHPIATYTAEVGSAARAFLMSIQGTIYWRVDAKAGDDVATGDVWSFDPRPSKAVYVYPANKAVDQTLHVGAAWNAASAVETYVFRIIEKDGVLPTIISGLTAIELKDIGKYLKLKHRTTYYWRVDTVNQFGTTVGDTMEFRTIALNPPGASWEFIAGGSELGPFDGGIEGVDFRWIGDNHMITVRRIVAAANNRLWYGEA